MTKCQRVPVLCVSESVPLRHLSTVMHSTDMLWKVVLKRQRPAERRLVWRQLTADLVVCAQLGHDPANEVVEWMND